MSSLKKVLVPLDGSEYRLKILKEVEKFLTPAETELVLLRVATLSNVPPHALPGPLPGPYMSIGVFPEEVVERNEYHLHLSREWETLRDSVAAELKPYVTHLREMGYTVSTILRFGEPAEEILRVIEEESVELVAMTTRAREGLSRLILGSVAESILHHVNIPILLIHPAPKKPGPDQPKVVTKKVL